MLKKASRKKLKKNESSPLQMYLILRTSSGFINWTQAGVQQIDTEQKFKRLDDLDLKVMIYDLKKANLAEDKNYLEAVQRELARREAMKGDSDEN